MSTAGILQTRAFGKQRETISCSFWRFPSVLLMPHRVLIISRAMIFLPKHLPQDRALSHFLPSPLTPPDFEPQGQRPCTHQVVIMPVKWDESTNAALFLSIFEALAPSELSNEQKTTIETLMRQKGFDITWNAIRSESFLAVPPPCPFNPQPPFTCQTFFFVSPQHHISNRNNAPHTLSRCQKSRTTGSEVFFSKPLFRRTGFPSFPVTSRPRYRLSWRCVASR